MGVRGLWRLLLPIGRRISIETLEGKILAIDASIWLTQFLKAMRDPETGSVKPAAHLIGFLRRLAKLRFHGIRPVLVFDGATPEIKLREVQQRRQRREQFASTGQAAVQRMAKRLLLEQLKKKRAAEASTGGGNSGGGGAYAPGFQPAEEEVHKEGNKEETKTSGAAPSKDSHEAIMAEIVDLEEEWKEKPLVEDQNDWDNPVMEAASEDEDDQSSSLMYNHTYDVFNVDRISCMPSHARKDAVEEAKRQQRMRSRREFMPVAGQPEQYSQAQLRNFLRSIRLNQQIVDMAKKIVGGDEGIGERVASDATRRIVFTKDSDKKSEPPRGEWKRLQKGKAAAGHTDKLPPEDEDDEEFEWEDGEVASAKRKSSPRNITAIEDDDSDDSASVKGDGGFVASMSTMATTVPVIQIDSDSDDGDGGGFIFEDGASKVPLADGAGRMNNLKASEEGKKAFTEEMSVDARRAQELEDEILASALQETESNQSDDAATNEGRFYTEKSVESLKASVKQINIDAALAGRLQEAEEAEPNEVFSGPLKDDSTALDDDDDSDNVDWEDGDQEDDVRNGTVPGANMSQAIDRTAPLDDRIALFDQQERVDDVGNSDDDIEWESGGDAVGQSEIVARRQELFRKAQGHDDTKRLEEDRGNGGQNAARSKLPKKCTGGSIASKSYGDENGFDAPVADQNILALEQAQATAANLTNWAGRAFRRAIAAHTEQTAASPEKVINPSPRKDVFEVDSEHSDSGEIEVDRSDPKAHRAVEVDSEDSDDLVEGSSQKAGRATSSPNQTPPVASGSSLEHTAESDRASLHDTSAKDPPRVNLRQDASITLQAQEDILAVEQNRQERDMDTVTDEMKSEVIQLIQLFGIPYVESPAEAEAQCVKLEELGLVDGIVTEDSDVFVFGGQAVYKNIFDDQKYVETYLAKDAERDLALGRNQMVALAMLLGGDYTEGVKGVGIVNGMEVLQAFDVSDSVKDGLGKFQQWLDGFDPDDAIGKKLNAEELSTERTFHVKHRTARTQWIAPKHFPADNVINAYLKPVVDTSSEPFTWGTPDLDKLLVFCERNLGWGHDETRKLLEPVLQRLTDTTRQTRLESFFMKYDDNITFANVKSKRLREVFQGIQQASQDGEASKKKARTNP